MGLPSFMLETEHDWAHGFEQEGKLHITTKFFSTIIVTVHWSVSTSGTINESVSERRPLSAGCMSSLKYMQGQTQSLHRAHSSRPAHTGWCHGSWPASQLQCCRSNQPPAVDQQGCMQQPLAELKECQRLSCYNADEHQPAAALALTCCLWRTCSMSLEPDSAAAAAQQQRKSVIRQSGCSGQPSTAA